MSWRKVSPGQKLRQAPIFRAGYINDAIDVVSAYKDGRLSGPSRATPTVQSPGVVYVRNLVGSNLVAGQVVQLGAHLLAEVTQDHPWFEGNLIDDPAAGRLAILTQPLPAGEIGPAQVAGICPAAVALLDAEHTHATPVAGFTLLKSSEIGPLELLMVPDESGLYLLWVKIDHKENYCYHVTLTAGISPGGSGSVTLPDGRTVTATNWSSDTPLVLGDVCLCFEDLVDSTFYLIKTGGEPQTRIWHSTAIDDVAAGATATVELSDSTQVEATNWSDDVDISANDKIHVYEDPFDSLYYAIKSGGTGGTRWFKANLTGTLESTDTSASVGSVVALDGDTAPAITTATNWLKKAGTNGSVVAIVEDLSGEEPAYLLMDVIHKEVSVDIAVEVDDPDDPTVLRQWKRTICVMSGNDDSNPEDIVELEDVEVDTNVKTDSGGNPTKLQQTKRTIKSFPKPDDTADSDVIGIEEC